MKRLIVACAVMATIILGTAAPAAAQSANAAAVISHACVEGVGQGTITVRGEVVSTQTVPAEGSEGRGPCLPPPGQTGQMR